MTHYQVDVCEILCEAFHIFSAFHFFGLCRMQNEKNSVVDFDAIKSTGFVFDEPVSGYIN